ncbi:MAG: phospholipase, partial [Pedosphaera sp.]|nr:phospholipase [Pedosphaera sp.]
PEALEKIKRLPIWVFHGAKDPTVPVKNSEEMTAALKKLNANIKLTIYPDAVHDSWTQTYANPELYDWLLSHDRKSNAHIEK